VHVYLRSKVLERIVTCHDSSRVHPNSESSRTNVGEPERRLIRYEETYSEYDEADTCTDICQHVSVLRLVRQCAVCITRSVERAYPERCDAMRCDAMRCNAMRRARRLVVVDASIVIVVLAVTYAYSSCLPRHRVN